MSEAWSYHLLLSSIGLAAASLVAVVLRTIWRKDPVSCYRMLVVLLLAALSLPIAQRLVQGRASHLETLLQRITWSDPSEQLPASPTPVPSTQIPSGLQSLLVSHSASNSVRSPEVEPFLRAPLPKKSKEWKLWPAIEEFFNRGGLQGLYFLGVLLFTLRHGLRHLRTRRLLRACEECHSGEAFSTWRRVSANSSLRQPVRLVLSDTLRSPACWGILRPVLVIPRGAAVPAQRKVLEMALRHELIHLERGDALVALLQALLTTVFWFHPASWWISSQLNRWRELSCDLLVVARTGCHRSYALALLQYAQASSINHSVETNEELPTAWRGSDPVCPTLLHWSRSRSELRRRIEMLANSERQLSWSRKTCRWLAAGAVFGILGTGQLAIAAVLFPSLQSASVPADPPAATAATAPMSDPLRAAVQDNLDDIQKVLKRIEELKARAYTEKHPEVRMLREAEKELQLTLAPPSQDPAAPVPGRMLNDEGMPVPGASVSRPADPSPVARSDDARKLCSQCLQQEERIDRCLAELLALYEQQQQRDPKSADLEDFLTQIQQLHVAQASLRAARKDLEKLVADPRPLDGPGMPPSGARPLATAAPKLSKPDPSVSQDPETLDSLKKLIYAAEQHKQRGDVAAAQKLLEAAELEAKRATTSKDSIKYRSALQDAVKSEREAKDAAAKNSAQAYLEALSRAQKAGDRKAAQDYTEKMKVMEEQLARSYASGAQSKPAASLEPASPVQQSGVDSLQRIEEMLRKLLDDRDAQLRAMEQTLRAQQELIDALRSELRAKRDGFPFGALNPSLTPPSPAIPPTETSMLPVLPPSPAGIDFSNIEFLAGNPNDSLLSDFDRDGDLDVFLPSTAAPPVGVLPGVGVPSSPACTPAEPSSCIEIRIPLPYGPGRIDVPTKDIERYLRELEAARDQLGAEIEKLRSDHNDASLPKAKGPTPDISRNLEIRREGFRDLFLRPTTLATEK